VTAPSRSPSGTFDLDEPRFGIQVKNTPAPTEVWSQATSVSTARWGEIGGDITFHSIVGGIMSVKNNNGFFATAASIMNGTIAPFSLTDGSSDSRRAWMKIKPTLFVHGIGTITTNFFLDFSKNFNDSATADSLGSDLQNPAVLTAITGTRTINDPLDFNADNFAEGDGAYTYAAASGVANFRFANTVTSFYPAFRISSWTNGTLPDYVIVDNQTLTLGYQYNAYINTATSELIMQFNKTYAPGTHVFYISHKTGLAVTLRTFEAKGGQGVDTLQWSTESEFENLGFHIYRRIAPGNSQIDSSLAGGTKAAGAGIANALMDAARAKAAARQSAGATLDKVQAASVGVAGDSALDTLASQSFTIEELAALGYERITRQMISGAKGGSSATTRNYEYVDRSAAFGVAYDYLLEAIDFNGTRVQYGPRTARPNNPLETALLPNYPNPFNPITTLQFTLKEKAEVTLVIYDGKGRVVRTLLRSDKPMLAGRYRLIWDAKNEGGIEVPSGQYFYRFTAPHYQKTRKMILVK
jgi:hypothetical protein